MKLFGIFFISVLSTLAAAAPDITKVTECIHKCYDDPIIKLDGVQLTDCDLKCKHDPITQMGYLINKNKPKPKPEDSTPKPDEPAGGNSIATTVISYQSIVLCTLLLSLVNLS